MRVIFHLLIGLKEVKSVLSHKLRGILKKNDCQNENELWANRLLFHNLSQRDQSEHLFHLVGRFQGNLNEELCKLRLRSTEDLGEHYLEETSHVEVFVSLLLN